MNFFTTTLLLLFLTACIGLWYESQEEQQKILLPFSEKEQSLIALHGPWPNKPPADAGNSIRENYHAQALGEKIFLDPTLSSSGSIACASCHQPDRAFTDGLATAQGVTSLERNTPSLLNTAQNIWFGWGGESDSLWSHNIIPLTAKEEMAASAELIQQIIVNSANYNEQYAAIFGNGANAQSSEQVLVNVAKVLAAYQYTLVTEPSKFDIFRDALLNNNIEQAVQYSLSAQRGLKIFIGKGQCHLCHFGPNFSNGEFADIGIPFFTDDSVDSGRYNGIKTMKSSAYNRLSIYSDNNEQSERTVSINLQHRNWGEFKVPSLRGIANTAPYMHNGSLSTLADVINHYSTVSEERLHTDGEKIVNALKLNQKETNDLLTFLKTL